MELVINIDDKIYEEIKNRNNTCNIYMPHAYASIYAIENGTPLPKGHGRLIDINDIEPMSYTVDGGDYLDNYKAVDWEDIEKAQTIIEADES